MCTKKSVGATDLIQDFHCAAEKTTGCSETDSSLTKATQGQSQDGKGCSPSKPGLFAHNSASQMWTKNHPGSCENPDSLAQLGPTILKFLA